MKQAGSTAVAVSDTYRGRHIIVTLSATVVYGSSIPRVGGSFRGFLLKCLLSIMFVSP